MFQLAAHLKAPTSLADLGLGLDAIEGVAKAVAGAPVANPRAFTEEDVSYLVRQAYFYREPLRSAAPFDELGAQERERN